MLFPLRLWDDAGDFVYEKSPMTLTVFELFTEDGEGLGPVVRKAVWQQTLDLGPMRAAVNRSMNFEPTIVVRDSVVGTEQLSRRASKKIHACRVPVVWFDPRERISSDVCAVGFEFFSGDQPPAVLRLQWSDGKPFAWEPIAEWWGRLRNFLALAVVCGTRGRPRNFNRQVTRRLG